ncbi:hypothetical protein, partial [Pseudomonas aeruginosa]
MDRPRFSSAFLHPRYWPLWFGLGLVRGLRPVAAQLDGGTRPA